MRTMQPASVAGCIPDVDLPPGTHPTTTRIPRKPQPVLLRLWHQEKSASAWALRTAQDRARSLLADKTLLVSYTINPQGFF